MRFKNNAVFLGYNFDGYNDHLCKRCGVKEVETTCFCLECDEAFYKLPSNFRIVEFSESDQFKRAYPLLRDFEKEIVDERIKRAKSVVLNIENTMKTKAELKENRVKMMQEIEGYKEIVAQYEAERKEYLEAYKEDYEAYVAYREKQKQKAYKGSKQYFEDHADLTTPENFEVRKNLIAETLRRKEIENNKKVAEIIEKAKDVFNPDQMLRVYDIFQPKPTKEQLEERAKMKKENEKRIAMRINLKEKESKYRDVFYYGNGKYQVKVYSKKGKLKFTGSVFTDREEARKEALQLRRLEAIYIEGGYTIPLKDFLEDRIKYLYKCLE